MATSTVKHLYQLDQFELQEDGRYAAEASTLGLKAGYFPMAFDVQFGRDAIRFLRQDSMLARGEDVMYINYKAAPGFPKLEAILIND